MNKKKFYFGRRHLKLSEHDVGYQNKVPRMFRQYFQLRQKLRVLNAQLKLSVNGVSGATRNSGFVQDDEAYANETYFRHEIARTLRLSHGITQMGVLVNRISDYSNRKKGAV